MKIYADRWGRLRRYLAYGNKQYIYSNIVWNFLNPDNVLKDGEQIHHIDCDTLNDMPHNLEKLSRKEHASYHAQRRNVLTRHKLSIAATHQHSQRTHCKNGHPLSGDNLHVYMKKYGNGKVCYERRCRACRSFYNAEYNARREVGV